MKSPCLECELVGKDGDKKNPICAACEKRKNYVTSLGGLSESIPLELTNMGRKIQKSKWTESEIRFLKENINKMTHKQMGEHLGRSVGAVSARCSLLNIKKDFDSLDRFQKNSHGLIQEYWLLIL